MHSAVIFLLLQGTVAENCVGYPAGLLVPVNVACDMETSCLYNWLRFVTIELYYNLLYSKIYGIYSAKARSRNVNESDK